MTPLQFSVRYYPAYDYSFTATGAGYSEISYVSVSESFHISCPHGANRNRALQNDANILFEKCFILFYFKYQFLKMSEVVQTAL